MSRPAAPAVAVLAALLAGCTSGPPASPPKPAAPVSRPTTAPAPATTPGTPAPAAPADTNGAVPAPAWLGTRVLPAGPDGFGAAQGTPAELRDRRLITVERLPPPADGRFHSRIRPVPSQVVQRSTWTARCPLPLTDLRYVTVGFIGFDGRAHTGELLVHRTVAKDVVAVFRQLFAAGWPIEEMRITDPAELDAPSTGDGNNTSAFVCRPVRGSSTWSQHAYGLAIDVNPFHNPYLDDGTLLPELATAYTDRGRRVPGVITANSVPVRAFRSIGWGWGGDYSSKKDWMHFSANGK